MAAPSNTVWGNTITSGTSSGKIGISATVTTTNTQVKVVISTWFWSKYGVDDTNNSYYYNAASSATTLIGSVSIKHTVSSGSGWSTLNQTKLGSTTYTYDRGTSASTKTYSAKLTGIDILGASGVMTVSKSVTVPALTSYSISYNANGGSGAPSAQTKYYGRTLTLSSTKPTRTGYTFVGWATSSGATSAAYSAGGSFTTNANTTLYAVWKIITYTVSYNTNGGSGAPSNQTKTYGQTLTLSSTKPTRTGYTFVGWGTSASATSKSYDAGGSYTSNAAITLYAVWKIITYTVSYNANGGTGVPSNQTKTYGQTLTLSSTKPTRDKYNFLGWATSVSATSASYASGGSYAGNSNLTLYAVWELAYMKPRINNVVIYRSDYMGTKNDGGKYVHIEFDWVTDRPVTSIKIEYRSLTDSTFTSIVNDEYDTNDNATVGGYIGTPTTIFDVNNSYTIRITVTDIESSYVFGTLSGSVFTIDCLNGGNGIAFGKKSELEDTIECGWPIYPLGGFIYPVLDDGTDINTIKTPGVYVGNPALTSAYVNCPITTDAPFILEVFPCGTTGCVLQRISTWTNVYHTWSNYYNGSTWSTWYGAH